uniref:Uncharacterized protein n=1 Tax=Mustela putorius furo TaxID=9669 RepID=M3YUX6_MUSPF
LEKVPVDEVVEVPTVTQQVSESEVDGETAMEPNKLSTSEAKVGATIWPEGRDKELEETIAEETPFQDKEQLSDVETWGSQEHTDERVGRRDLATKLMGIPKESQTEKENTETVKGKDAVGFRDQATPKTPKRSREVDLDKQTQKRGKGDEGAPSPPSSACGWDQNVRDDTPTSRKKVQIKDHNFSREQHWMLFDQEVAPWEAQKQQQWMETLGMTSPLPSDSLGYSAPHHPFAGYSPGYPMQASMDPSNGAGKVLLPTPSMDPVCSHAPYNHSQPLVELCMEPLTAPLHVAAPEVSSSQYVTQSDDEVHQDFQHHHFASASPRPSPQIKSGVWDSNQSLSVSSSSTLLLQSQATIYSQGHIYPTVYGVTPYSQTAPPAVQYAQPSRQYTQEQQISTAHAQPMQRWYRLQVVTWRPRSLQPPEMVANNLLDLPSPFSPNPKIHCLSSQSKIQKGDEITRQTQWDPPTWEGPGEDASLEHEAEMDLRTLTYDEKPRKTS